MSDRCVGRKRRARVVKGNAITRFSGVYNRHYGACSFGNNPNWCSGNCLGIRDEQNVR